MTHENITCANLFFRTFTNAILCSTFTFIWFVTFIFVVVLCFFFSTIFDHIHFHWYEFCMLQMFYGCGRFSSLIFISFLVLSWHHNLFLFSSINICGLISGTAELLYSSQMFACLVCHLVVFIFVPRKKIILLFYNLQINWSSRYIFTTLLAL